MTDPWCSGVPALFRALADSDLSGAIPGPDARSLEGACATWGALDYLLRNAIGWKSVGKGLAWWYAAGMPTESSPALALVRDVWGKDNHLDYYAAWTWRPPGTCILTSRAEGPIHGPS